MNSDTRINFGMSSSPQNSRKSACSCWLFQDWSQVLGLFFFGGGSGGFITGTVINNRWVQIGGAAAVSLGYLIEHLRISCLKPVSGLGNVVTNLGQNGEELEKGVENLGFKIQQLQKTCQDLEEQLNNAKILLNERKETINQQSSDINDLKEQLEKAEKGLEQFQNLYSGAKKTLKEFGIKIQEFNKTGSVIKTEETLLNKEENELISENKKITNDLDFLQKKNFSYVKENEKFQNIVIKFQEGMSDFGKKYESLQKDFYELNLRIEELQKINKSRGQTTERIEKLSVLLKKLDNDDFIDKN